MKKISNKLPIAFVVLLTACAPLAYLYFMIVLKIMSVVSMDAWKKTLLVAMVPIAIYWLVIGILEIMNIYQSFKAYRAGDPVACVNGMLIHKYGLVAFFCINFVILFFFYFFVSIGVIMGTRGMALLLSPVLLPIWIIGVACSVCATWLAILPGAFYGIQVIRMSYKERKITFVAAVVHMILQFFFLTDVLDAMYLAVGKWNRGKKSSVVISVVYIAAIIGIIILAVKIKSEM